MNRRKGLRDRWLPHVLDGHTGASYGCRLMLTVMYFRMTEKGYVSVPRTELADILGVGDRQVTRWIREAIDARLLDKVGGGYHGRTAEYAAVIPCRKVGGNNPPSRAKVAAGVTDKQPTFHRGKPDRKVDRNSPPNTRA
jgi:hypothetical protein